MRHVIGWMIAAAMLLGLGLAPVRADSMVSGMAPNLCLDWNTGTNAVALWACHGGYNQNFFSSSVPGQQHYGSMCLDQSGNGPGANLVMAQCAGKPSQNWQLIGNASDPYAQRLRNGANLCVNIPRGNAVQGTQLIVWTCQTGAAPNDRWNARVATASQPTPAPQPVRPPPPVTPQQQPAPPPQQQAAAPIVVPNGLMRQGYNTNVPACPGATRDTIATDKFTDGGDLPSCGGREVNGNVITTYKMVWTGQSWAKFVPSIQVTTLAPQPAPLPPNLPVQPPQPGPTPPPLQPGQEPPLPDPNATDRIDAAPEIQPALAQMQQAIDNFQALSNVMAQDSAGPNALWDPAAVRTINTALNVARQLLLGASYPLSLGHLMRGDVTAMDDADRRDLAVMFAAAGGAFAKANAAFADALDQAPKPVKTALDEQKNRRDRYRNPLLVQVQYPAPVLGRYDNLGAATTFSGLDRAGRLAAILSLGRKLQTAQVFADFGSTFEGPATYSLESKLSEMEANLKKSPADKLRVLEAEQQKMARYFKKYGIVKLNVQLAIVMLNFAAAAIPSSISAFYMQIENRKIDSYSNPQTHVIELGKSVETSIWVTPYSPGGQIVTPLGLIGILTDLNAAPRIVAAMQRMGLGPAWEQKMRAYYSAVMRKLTKYQVDTVLTVLGRDDDKVAKFIASPQNIFSLPAFNNKPVEINDQRVVKLTVGPQGDTKALLLGTSPNQRYFISAVNQGSTQISGELMIADLYKAATGNSSERFFRLPVTVYGVPSIPGFKACHNLNDGGVCNPATHKCEALGGGVIQNATPAC